MAFAPDALRQDFFLGGRVVAWQPRRGYRSSTDAVFLAASVPAGPGETVLELGCGAGVASLCLAARVPGVSVTGVEVQAAYAALGRQNGLRVVEANLADLPPEVRSVSFDHVLANPPYFDRAAPSAGDVGRDAARREMTALEIWVDAALRRLTPGGWITLIHRAERLPDLLAALSGRGGSVRVLPLIPRAGRNAGRIIVQARKGSRGPFRLLSGLVVHEGAAHDMDRDSFTDTAAGVLRDGNRLDLGAR